MTHAPGDLIPANPDLAALRKAIPQCEGCDLYRHATQAVMGEGPPRARVMFVGEQPQR
jgi:uracil-DNA glycosylase